MKRSVHTFSGVIFRSKGKFVVCASIKASFEQTKTIRQNFTSAMNAAPMLVFQRLCVAFRTIFCTTALLLLVIIAQSALFNVPSLCAQQLVSATGATYRIAFRDKGAEAFTPESRIVVETMRLHSARALERRRKFMRKGGLANALSAELPVSLADAPLHEPYLDSLRKLGAVVILRIRWQNYAVVTFATAQIEQRLASVRAMPFVRAFQAAGERLLPQRFSINAVSAVEKTLAQSLNKADVVNCGSPRYGDSFQQLASVRIPQIHALGVGGQGVIVGVMDSGFRWRDQTSTKGARVLAEWDVMQNDSVTANQRANLNASSNPLSGATLAPDETEQDKHGTEVFSVIAGYDPGQLIGSAYGASFLLAKTEDLRYERHIEQDNYAAALEWMEARGVDIMTASVGYRYFDAPEESYSYKELDGKTSIVARAVNEASKRGVLCVIPAGNEGRSGAGSISTPGDADSALTVAAARRDSFLPTAFSSRGPRGDGRMKPDIAAQGDTVVQATTVGEVYRTGNGTSYSTPIIAGAAALLLSAFPELTAPEIKHLLLSTASQATKPDNALGYGIANVEAAMRRVGTVIAPELVSFPLYDTQRIGISALPLGISLKAMMFTKSQQQTTFTATMLQPSMMTSLYMTDIPFTQFAGNPLECYAVVDDGVKNRRIPAEGTVLLEPRRSSVPCGIAAETLALPLPLSVQEGIFPSPAARDAAVNLLLATPEAARLQYTLYSALGQEVGGASAQVTAGISIVPVSTRGLGLGVYYVRVAYNGSLRVFRFVLSS
jgi:serine protease AprX